MKPPEEKRENREPGIATGISRDVERRLRPSEVEAVLRRSAELNSRRWSRLRNEGGGSTVSGEVVVQVAASAGIPEDDARRALQEVFSRKAADPPSYQRTLLGSARVRAVREVEHPADQTSEYLEELLRRDAELKLRHKSEGVTVWEPGSAGGMMRRTLDISADRPLLKTRSVELVVEESGDERRCTVDFIADLSNQRSEQTSLAVLIGVTLALMFFLAGIQNPVFLLGVIPALLAPSGAFRLAFMKSRHDTLRVLDALQDAAETGIPKEIRPAERPVRNTGQIQGLEPIPRFVPKDPEKEKNDPPGDV